VYALKFTTLIAGLHHLDVENLALEPHWKLSYIPALIRSRNGWQ
jgi:hypothetical protein